MIIKRSLPIGAEVHKGGVEFRIWAPIRKKVEVILRENELIENKSRVYELKNEGNGYFSLNIESAAEGMLYQYRFDNSDNLYPDPASRYQPEGPHGPSMVIDPNKYIWKDEHWEGVPAGKEILYEMHIGTFTTEGTYKAAAGYLYELADLGITVIELMPVADFPGNFGWGYDGVNLFAPTRLYGTPDELRAFIDAAHKNGLAVILDVVYNHMGPDGNYLYEFSPYYSTKKYKTDWGDALNFDGPESESVREYFISNAGYWIEEFHFDGLRLDATQDIHDTSSSHILADISKVIREKGKRRKMFIVAENEPQKTRLIKPLTEGGYGLDAMWNDDFHHSAIVALTGKNEAYYTDYLGKPQEFISSLKYGYLYQGQYYKWQKQRRGSSSLNIDPEKMVLFIENHDQVANSARGERILKVSAPSLYRAMTALMILGPGTPMLFQGQEFASSKPFNYFADLNSRLADTVCKGRIEFLSQFRSIASTKTAACVPDPGKLDTFRNCKLDHNEKEINKQWLLFHRDLLLIKKNERGFNGKDRIHIDGAVLGDQSFIMRYFLSDGMDRIMLVNLGVDLDYNPAPEPLIAPPESMKWELLWSSEDPEYGANGIPDFPEDSNWIIPGHSTTIFKPVAKGD